MTESDVVGVAVKLYEAETTIAILSHHDDIPLGALTFDHPAFHRAIMSRERARSMFMGVVAAWLAER